MKIVFLIPPSEGKNGGGEFDNELLSFQFDKPKEIALNATEKDLKCIGKRFIEAKELNKGFFSHNKKTLRAITRYSGVMYNAIGYENMSRKGKSFFEDNFLITSGMYGILKMEDKISNYKLPIETKGLVKFRGDNITERLNDMGTDYVVNLLPMSYGKMINKKKLKPKLININFLQSKDGVISKISHGVKKIKGEWIKKVCEGGNFDYKKQGGEIIENKDSIDINLTIY